jgi:hypothetical protein
VATGQRGCILEDKNNNIFVSKRVMWLYPGGYLEDKYKVSPYRIIWLYPREKYGSILEDNVVCPRG